MCTLKSFLFSLRYLCKKSTATKKFADIPNALTSQEQDRPQMRKDNFPVSPALQKYLQKYNRDTKIPVNYRDLLKYRYGDDLRDKYGNLTHWQTAIYDLREMELLKENLIATYATLKTEGNLRHTGHLDVERIDFCEFGNSVPFRIRIINTVNGNYDHFYVKAADASRIYGLELEHLLSPNYLVFLYHSNTLIEEHIPGIPGDIFLDRFMNNPEHNKIRIAKEFVKFNERCFARLLGDMRSYNFVVDITPDIEDYQYRIRAIDFDQQSYEGNKKFYLPQFYKENYAYVTNVLENISPKVIEQYQDEERNAIAYRIVGNRRRLLEFFDAMVKDDISEFYKIKLLREGLNEHFNTTAFSKCNTMGCLVKKQLKQMITTSLKNLRSL